MLKGSSLSWKLKNFKEGIEGHIESTANFRKGKKRRRSFGIRERGMPWYDGFKKGSLMESKESTFNSSNEMNQ